MPPLEDQLRPSTDPQDVPRRLVLARAAIDSDTLVEPAAMLLREGRVEAVGTPAELGRPEVDRVERLEDSVLIPSLVNAHTHLDLWSVGSVSLDAGFDAWLATIRDRRPVEPDAIEASVRAGVEASILGGVGAVGDIAGAFGTIAAAAFARSPLAGTSFIEVFGIGRRTAAGLEAIERLREVIPTLAPAGRVGLSPHAPYSCDAGVFAAAAATGLPVSTHLAETPEEAAFTRWGDGPFVDLLHRVGSLGEGERPEVSGRHPVDQLVATSPARPWLLAHVNYLSEPDEPEAEAVRRAERLRAIDATVVYCPRAAQALGHPRAGRESHPWSFLRSHGVRVALGTDGRPCLDRSDRLSTLDDVRLLLSDGVAPSTAISMATTEAAVGLGLAPDAVRFAGGCGAGVLAIEVGDEPSVATALAKSESMPRWLLPLRASVFGPAGHDA